MHVRLERELDEKKALLITAFACLICKEVVSPEREPLVPPCCRAAVMYRECIMNWIDNQQTCPHCREGLTLENCLPIHFAQGSV